MGLSCSCPDGDFDYYYEQPEDFTVLPTSKRKRCCSCKTLIDKNATVLQFNRFRYPKPDSIEERIEGEGCEIYIAPFWMCESCGDQYMNLTALKFCVDPTENMVELVKEYAEVYGKKKAA
jgi:hypothetical protein